MKSIKLKAKREEAVKRFHPWIFSGAVKQMEKGIADGERVKVVSHRGEFLGIGHYQKSSICVRIFSFDDIKIDQPFWNDKLEKALSLRQLLGLTSSETTNCYRLIHGEGDGLPGLVIDIYDTTAVIQCHSIGMFKEREFIKEALIHVYEGHLENIFDKSSGALPSETAQEVENKHLLGKAGNTLVKEYNHLFKVDWEKGQKTGFFLDQRENRQLLTKYVKNKKVLNTFCYTGGFSVYAQKAGAALTHSVDISQHAIDLTNENMEINELSLNHQAYCADVMKFLKENDQTYDVIVVDPPAFAKSINKRHNAVQAYKRLNALALQRVKDQGIIFTFSCSQVVDDKLFYNTIVAAAIEAGKTVSVIHRLSQPPDHPVSLFHPEGSYLKGLVLNISKQ